MEDKHIIEHAKYNNSTHYLHNKLLDKHSSEGCNNQEEKRRQILKELRSTISQAPVFNSIKEHQYFSKKGIELKYEHDLRICNKIVYQPLYNFNEVKNLEVMNALRYYENSNSGNNKYPFEGLKTGGAFGIVGCKPQDVISQKDLAIVEGISDALAVFESTGIVSLNVGSKSNIANVVSSIHKNLSDVKLYLFADIDALEINRSISAKYEDVYVIPTKFSEEELLQSDKLSDIWDEWSLGGEERVREALSRASKVIDTKCLNIYDFLKHPLQPKEYILSPILKEGSLIMIYAQRGVGKTFVSLEIGLTIAGGESMFNNKWNVSNNKNVLFIDGEMVADAMQERLCQMIKSNNFDFTPDKFKIITPDCYQDPMPDLSTKEGQESIERYLENIDVLIIDNLSTLCRTGRENEAESWRITQDWILSLRKRNIAVILIHHSGKNNSQRGTSKKEDILDVVISLKHPEDYLAEDGARFIISYEKARGFKGEDAKSFEARKIKDGWDIIEVEKQEKEEIIQYKNSNPKASIRNIAKELGYSKSKIQRVLKEHDDELSQNIYL